MLFAISSVLFVALSIALVWLARNGVGRLGIRKSATIDREASGAAHIPFVAHVDPATLKTAQGDYVQVFRFEGIAHETAHDDEIEVWHHHLGLFMRNINSANLALWSYVKRVETDEYVQGEFEPGYAREFDQRYRASVTTRRMYVNELYVAIVYRPETSLAARAAERFDPAMRDKEKLLSKPNLQRNSAAVERITQIGGEVEKYLRRYAPERLERYARDVTTGIEYRGEEFANAPASATLFSEPLEFFGFMINGEHQRMPYLRAAVNQTLQTARITFGRETTEQRTASSIVYGAALGLKEYPDPSFPGQFNELLRAPFEFIFAQSYSCLDKAAARGALKRQYARLESTEDDAAGEVEQLQIAIEELASNRFSIGEHQATLFVRGRDLKSLQSAVGEARRSLADSGAVVVREDLGCESTFWSMLAGNLGDRPRPSPITSQNFVGFSPLHNYPSGKRDGNHWGPALALLKTASGAPYFLSLHRGDIGHFAMFGSTGAGKTVLAMFLVLMLQKFKPTLIYFDKDHGAEIGLRALGAQYFSLKRGEPTGLNPFGMERTERNIGFVGELLRIILRTKDAFTASEEAEIDRAVAGVFSLDANQRRLASVLAFFEPPSGNNLSSRLQRWVHSDRGVGALAWVFDNTEDRLDLAGARLFGFDMTHFIDNDDVRTPMMAYLFHRIDLLKDGRRGAVIIDEGWKALDDPYFEDKIRDSLKTDRKRNWLLGLITQSPSDSLKSRIAHTIAEQTPTKFFLPNIFGKREHYVEGFGCTEGEFDAVKALQENGRRFVVKQGQNAVVCELDLNGFDDDLAIMSGTTPNIAILERVLAEYGEAYEQWGPAFQRERLAA